MNNILKEYDLSFRKFLSRGIGRSQLASMIYAVSGNKRVGVGYEGETPYKLEFVDDMKITYKPLYDQFKYDHSHDIRLTSHAKSLAAKKQKENMSWYLDSGCSRHMTGKRSMFQDLVLKSVGEVKF